MIDVSHDPRIDPRIKAVLSGLGTPGGGGDVENRAQLLAEAIFLAAIIGLFGGLFPAIRAARLPIAMALRES